MLRCAVLRLSGFRHFTPSIRMRSDLGLSEESHQDLAGRTRAPSLDLPCTSPHKWQAFAGPAKKTTQTHRDIVSPAKPLRRVRRWLLDPDALLCEVRRMFDLSWLSPPSTSPQWSDHQSLGYGRLLASACCRSRTRSRTLLSDSSSSSSSAPQVTPWCYSFLCPDFSCSDVPELAALDRPALVGSLCCTCSSPWLRRFLQLCPFPACASFLRVFFIFWEGRMRHVVGLAS